MRINYYLKRCNSGLEQLSGDALFKEIKQRLSFERAIARNDREKRKTLLTKNPHFAEIYHTKNGDTSLPYALQYPCCKKTTYE